MTTSNLCSSKNHYNNNKKQREKTRTKQKQKTNETRSLKGKAKAKRQSRTGPQVHIIKIKIIQFKASLLSTAGSSKQQREIKKTESQKKLSVHTHLFSTATIKSTPPKHSTCDYKSTHDCYLSSANQPHTTINQSHTSFE